MTILRRALTFVSILILKAILDFLYTEYVTVYFVYDLFFKEFSYEKYISSYFLLLVTSIFILPVIEDAKKPSRVAILVLFLCLILPLLTLYAYQNAPAGYVLTIISSFILMVLIIRFMPRFEIKKLHGSFVNIIIGAFMIIIVYVYLYLISTGGLARFNVNFYDVYNTRSEYVAAAASGPFMAYLIPWTAHVFNLSMIVWGLFKKDKRWVFVGIFLQFLLFGMTNFKSYIFAPIVVIILYFVTKKKELLLYSTLGIAFLLTLSYAVFLVTNNHLWASILVRRQFFVPANLHLIYYDYFHKDFHPFIYLSNSIFDVFLEYPYSLNVTRVISWEYWGKDFGPNVGIWGDAYSHFGLFGIFLFSVILAVFLKLIDSFTEILPSNLIAALISLPAFSLVNSALFTTLLTHGFLISIIMLFIMSNIQKNEDDINENLSLNVRSLHL